jgi:TM2 domain-containing membrane protein YozV
MQQSPPSQPMVVYHKPVSDKSRTITVILCLLGFIGLAGLHHFYAGKMVIGLIFLFTFGFLFIGTIVSLISILLGNFKDNTGAVIKNW